MGAGVSRRRRCAFFLPACRNPRTRGNGKNELRQACRSPYSTPRSSSRAGYFRHFGPRWVGHDSEQQQLGNRPRRTSLRNLRFYLHTPPPRKSARSIMPGPGTKAVGFPTHSRALWICFLLRTASSPPRCWNRYAKENRGSRSPVSPLGRSPLRMPGSLTLPACFYPPGTRSRRAEMPKSVSDLLCTLARSKQQPERPQRARPCDRMPRPADHLHLECVRIPPGPGSESGPRSQHMESGLRGGVLCLRLFVQMDRLPPTGA
jgi:hypothetical protein